MDGIPHCQRGFASHWHRAFRPVHHIHSHHGRDAEIERFEQNFALTHIANRFVLKDEIRQFGRAIGPCRDAPRLCYVQEYQDAGSMRVTWLHSKK